MKKPALSAWGQIRHTTVRVCGLKSGALKQMAFSTWFSSPSSCCFSHLSSRSSCLAYLETINQILSKVPQTINASHYSRLRFPSDWKKAFLILLLKNCFSIITISNLFLSKVAMWIRVLDAVKVFFLPYWAIVVFENKNALVRLLTLICPLRRMGKGTGYHEWTSYDNTLLEYH